MSEHSISLLDIDIVYSKIYSNESLDYYCLKIENQFKDSECSMNTKQQRYENVLYFFSEYYFPVKEEMECPD